GQGFCTILEGIWRYIRGEAVYLGVAGEAALSAAAPASLKEHAQKGRVTIEEEFGYEVVFLLHGENLDVDRIRQTIIGMGGVSTVVAGDEKMLKVHTHVPWPGKVLDYGVSLGSLLDINIENLQEQSLTYAAESEAEHAADQEEEVYDTSTLTPDLATIAVVSGAGFEKVFQGLGVSVIVPGGQTMNPSIEELLKAVNSVAAQKVIILPNNSNGILSARQVDNLADKEVYIVPTATMPQGIASLLACNYE